MEPGSGSVTYSDGQGAATPAPNEPMDLAVWVSEPLNADMVVSGLPLFEANVTASGHRASLILTLAERLPDGTDRAFNFAAISLNHANDLSRGRPDIAGMEQAVSVRFFPQDDVVHAGNSLVLIAAGSTAGGPGPGLIPVSDGSDITIAMEGASLRLPADTTLRFEDPQPCWDEAGAAEDCYLYP
jgi:hypothetical protein